MENVVSLIKYILFLCLLFIAVPLFITQLKKQNMLILRKNIFLYIIVETFSNDMKVPTWKSCEGV